MYDLNVTKFQEFAFEMHSICKTFHAAQKTDLKNIIPSTKKYLGKSHNSDHKKIV